MPGVAKAREAKCWAAAPAANRQLSVVLSPHPRREGVKANSADNKIRKGEILAAFRR